MYAAPARPLSTTAVVRPARMVVRLVRMPVVSLPSLPGGYVTRSLLRVWLGCLFGAWPHRLLEARLGWLLDT